MSQACAGRLMGGKHEDLALKKVIFSDSAQLWRLLCFDEHSTCRCFSSNSPSFLADNCFSGSMMACRSRVLLIYSFRGESLKLRTLFEDMMIQVVISSWVEGNSSRNSFLHCLVAVVSLRALSTGNASRLGSSRVSNLRLQTRPPKRPALAGSSSKYPKKEVFSGELCIRYDSAFLWRCAISWISGGRLKRREGGRRALECVRLGKKSRGSLPLLILMRLVLPLGQLSLPRRPLPSPPSLYSYKRRSSLLSLHSGSSSSIGYNYFIQAQMIFFQPQGGGC